MVKIRAYRRPDGKIGVRNYVLLLPVSLCASETARFVKERVTGTVYIPNQGGCAQVPKDLAIVLETLSGLAANPNVYGTVFLANGCETAQIDLVMERALKKSNKPHARVVIQEVGGTVKAVEEATRAAMRLVAEASAIEREEVDFSDIILATECGGSDPTSGLASNPVIGSLSDRVVAEGASVILSETTELIGAEHIVGARCATPEIRTQLLKTIADYEKHIQGVGENLRMGNPTPGNLVGGITTLEEKSLGCIHKGGHTTINEVLSYGAMVTKKGLVVMDTPGQDVASIAGMVAGGAQIIVFSTGRGTPTGFGIAPVIKLTANKDTFRMMNDNMDFDASPVIEGKATIKEMGDSLFDLMIDTINGNRTKAEILGFNDMSIARLCNFV
ncbi:MAG: UxaA family hydrolase [Treponemataceae bacterium]